MPNLVLAGCYKNCNWPSNPLCWSWCWCRQLLSSPGSLTTLQLYKCKIWYFPSFLKFHVWRHKIFKAGYFQNEYHLFVRNIEQNTECTNQILNVKISPITYLKFKRYILTFKDKLLIMNCYQHYHLDFSNIGFCCVLAAV